MGRVARIVAMFLLGCNMAVAETATPTGFTQADIDKAKAEGAASRDSEAAALKAQIARLTATQIPAKFEECSEQCLLQLAKLACVSGARNWEATDVANTTKGATTLSEFMNKLGRNCQLVPAPQVGDGAKKNATPLAARGTPKCAEGVFDVNLGICTRPNVTARQTDD